MDYFDYSILIKRNFIHLMHQHKGSSVSEEYEAVLLQLPNHPVLSLRDLHHVKTSVRIALQMKHMIDTGEDLHKKKN